MQISFRKCSKLVFWSLQVQSASRVSSPTGLTPFLSKVVGRCALQAGLGVTSHKEEQESCSLLGKLPVGPLYVWGLSGCFFYFTWNSIIKYSLGSLPSPLWPPLSLQAGLFPCPRLSTDENVFHSSTPFPLACAIFCCQLRYVLCRGF